MDFSVSSQMQQSSDGFARPPPSETRSTTTNTQQESRQTTENWKQTGHPMGYMYMVWFAMAAALQAHMRRRLCDVLRELRRTTIMCAKRPFFTANFETKT